MISTVGTVHEERGAVYITTTRPAVGNLADDVTVIWHDTRSRSADQLRKAWALMTDIATYQGESKDEVYREQKIAFTARNMEALQGMLFGLSTATMSEASAFITMLVEVIIEYGIQTREPLYKLTDDTEKYVYACMAHKKCAVCGQKAELHHVDAIGMGGNRLTKPQIGARCYPLCRTHHNEWHNIGGREFDKRYHLTPVRMDQRLADVYGLTKKARRVGDYGQ